MEGFDFGIFQDWMRSFIRKLAALPVASVPRWSSPNSATTADRQRDARNLPRTISKMNTPVTVIINVFNEADRVAGHESMNGHITAQK